MSKAAGGRLLDWVAWLDGAGASPFGPLPHVVVIDDPLLGHQAGLDAGPDAAKALRRLADGTLLQVRKIASTAAGGRTVLELEVLIGTGGERLTLPVAVVADTERVPGCTCLRTYYSRHLIGGSRLRPPFLAVAEVGQRGRCEPLDVVAGYQRALAAGDLAGVLGSLAADVTIREPSGGVHAGPTAAAAFYGELLRFGGVGLQHHAVTDDGTTCALEYSLVSFSGLALAPQAGLGVYVRAGQRLVAIRLYDDPAGP